MPKLTGYKEVAVIEIAGKDYHFAIYDDGQNYSVGDTVIVSGAARTGIREIKEIISIEAAETRCAKGITAEIISRVDLLDYRKRVEYRRAEAKLKNEINKAVSKVDRETKLKLFSENLPEIKILLDKYKELTGEDV